MYKPEEIPTPEDFVFLLNALKADQHQQQPQERRRVRFAPVVTSAPANPMLAFEDLKEFWYSASELSEIKMEARKLVYSLRLQQQQGRSSPSSPRPLGPAHGDGEENMRGFEHTSALRQKHRRMTIRCTISAARQGLRGEQLGLIASRCTQWNGEIAFVQACHDYASVYKPQMLAMMISSSSLTISENPPAFPFAVKAKRCSENTNTTSTGAVVSTRNVRQRVSIQ